MRFGTTSTLADDDYDTLCAPMLWGVIWDTQDRVYRWMRGQSFQAGRCAAPADPDVQLAPDDTLFPRQDKAEQIAAVREAAARKAAATDQRIHDYLRRRGPRTVSAIRSELGMSSFGVRSALSRRPDLFVTAGETRGKKGMATLWHIRQEA